VIAPAVSVGRVKVDKVIAPAVSAGRVKVDKVIAPAVSAGRVKAAKVIAPAVSAGRVKKVDAAKAVPVAPAQVAVKTRRDPEETRIETPLPARTSNQDTQFQKGRHKAALFLWPNIHAFMQHTLIVARLAKNT